MSAPPPLGPPPAGGDQDRGPQLMAMFWVETILAIAILSARFYVRLAIRGLGPDDWMMLLTVILFAIMTGFVTKLALIGGARHMYYLTPIQQLEAVKWSWIAQPWCIFLYATGKTAVAILILRIMGPNAKWRRWILYFFIASILFFNSLGCIITFIQCSPPRALWTPTIAHKCWNPTIQMHYNYFMAAWNMLMDAVLSLLPITIFWNMSIPPKKKIALCCLLGLGLVATVFTGIKVKYLVELSQRDVDFTWTLYDVQAWSAAEGFMVIVCGNIPPLQPLWDRFITHKLDSNYGRTPITGKSYLMSDRSKQSGTCTEKCSHHSTCVAASSKNNSRAESEYGKSILTTTEIDCVSTREVV